MISVAVDFISILANVLFFAIIIRALMSWFMRGDGGGLSRVLNEITDPILTPIRRVMPPMGGIDLSPLVAIVLIQVLNYVLTSLLLSIG